MSFPSLPPPVTTLPSFKTQIAKTGPLCTFFLEFVKGWVIKSLKILLAFTDIPHRFIQGQIRYQFFTAVKKWHAAMFCLFSDSKSEWKKMGNRSEFHWERNIYLQNWYFRCDFTSFPMQDSTNSHNKISGIAWGSYLKFVKLLQA